jgi:hypothetical protein
MRKRGRDRQASNMQKGAGAAGAGYAKSWRGLLGVRFAKWWGWWGAGLRQGMGVGSLAHRQSGSGRGDGGEAGTSILVLRRGGGGRRLENGVSVAGVEVEVGAVAGCGGFW